MGRGTWLSLAGLAWPCCQRMVPWSPLFDSWWTQSSLVRVQPTSCHFILLQRGMSSSSANLFTGLITLHMLKCFGSSQECIGGCVCVCMNFCWLGMVLVHDRESNPQATLKSDSDIPWRIGISIGQKISSIKIEVYKMTTLTWLIKLGEGLVRFPGKHRLTYSKAKHSPWEVPQTGFANGFLRPLPTRMQTSEPNSNQHKEKKNKKTKTHVSYKSISCRKRKWSSYKIRSRRCVWDTEKISVLCMSLLLSVCRKITVFQ